MILTHLHFDHAEGLAGWPQRRAFVHRLETEAPYAQIVSGVLEMVDLEILDGDEGEIEPGLRWLRTPGHSDGLISLLVDTDDGLTVIASDCVGPLPEYFEQMDLPEDFGPEREELLDAVAADPRARPRRRDPRPQPAGQTSITVAWSSVLANVVLNGSFAEVPARLGSRSLTVPNGSR